MSHVLTAHSGHYTLEVTDTTDSAPDVGTVQMSPLQLPYGNLRRIRGAGIYPFELSVIFDDPRDQLKDTLTGDITETDFEAVLTGPPGPNGTNFRLDLQPKARRRTSPISKRQYPDRTRVTFYDGLTRLRDEVDGAYSPTSVTNNPSIPQVLNNGLSVANSDLYAWVGIDVAHSMPDVTVAYGPGDLRNILFPKRVEEQWSTYWEPLKALVERYHLAIFQDPYSRGSDGKRARWLLIPATLLGATADGVSGDVAPFSGTITTETLSVDEVTVKKSALVTQNGEEYETAVTTQVIESLPSSQSSEEYSSLVLNAGQALRDGSFDFENSNNNEPLYGSTVLGTVQSARVELDPGNSNNATYETEPFNIGRGGFFAQLTYSFEQTSGDLISGFEVKLENIAGGSVTGGKGISQTIELDGTGPGAIQVVVTVPDDADSDIIATWGEATLKVWRSEFAENQGNDPNVQQTSYTDKNRGFIKQSIGPFVDMLLSGLPRVDSDKVAPTSKYTNNVTGKNSFTAGELAAETRLEAKPLGTQTLRTTIDQIVGPNTRIKVEDDTGTVQRELVMHGGRTLHLKDRYTELADIETPHP